MPCWPNKLPLVGHEVESPKSTPSVTRGRTFWSHFSNNNRKKREKTEYFLHFAEMFVYLHTQMGNFGLMAEWLGKGLQNLVQRFESASDLKYAEQTTF